MDMAALSDSDLRTMARSSLMAAGWHFDNNRDTRAKGQIEDALKLVTEIVQRKARKGEKDSPL